MQRPHSLTPQGSLRTSRESSTEVETTVEITRVKVTRTQRTRSKIVAVERPRRTDRFAAEMDAKIEEADVEIKQLDREVDEKREELQARYAALQSAVTLASPYSRIFQRVSKTALFPEEEQDAPPAINGHGNKINGSHSGPRQRGAEQRASRRRKRMKPVHRADAQASMEQSGEDAA